MRKWCPELKEMPDSIDAPETERGVGTFKIDCLYKPWTTPENIMPETNVVLGETYPCRVCDDRLGRSNFFQTMRELRSGWPSSMTDDRGRDLVPLGRKSEDKVGMFTPRAVLTGRSK